MITRKQAQALLQASKSTIIRMEKQGKLTPHRWGKRLVRYARAEVLSCLTSGAPAAAEAAQ